MRDFFFLLSAPQILETAMKKRRLLGCLAMVAVATVLKAQKSESDSLHMELQEVEILSVRASGTTPVAFTNIDRQQIEKINTGVDFPYLMSMTPSAVVTSDAGTGIGYTSLRIRGTDGTRINVTANGIPINDAESHNVFWVNMPDIASSIKDVQIQRGAGTSTNGAGAFGASINMRTSTFNTQPYAKADFSFGSFMTQKRSIAAGTGIIDDRWSLDLRFSQIGSDGYIDRARSDLNSYYMQGAYYGEKSTLRLIAFAGKEETYHAWNYASKEEMELYGRSYNSCGYMFTDENGKAHYYDDQTDNYMQQNIQLLFDHNFSNTLNMNIGLHYTKGDGYYQEYKSGRKLVEYRLQPYIVDGNEVKKSDLIRKKAMDNHFGGAVFSLSYRNNRVNATLGGGANRYFGRHFGQVLWVKEYIGNLAPNHEYYRNNGAKNDMNIYLKADYNATKGVNLYADMQYRHIGYKIEGNNDKWNYNTNALQRLDIEENFNFFNPKTGLSWQLNKHNRLFASIGITHKEPTRNNYTDGKLHERPKAEQLTDYEAGYCYKGENIQFGVNLYFMDYKDQLVLTGEVNEIGEPLATNIPESYRTGVEITAEAALPYGFKWSANATFSRNRIKDFTEVLYDDNTQERWDIHHNNTPIAFSPDIIANNSLSYERKGFEASLQSQYVSKQYMSNCGTEEHILDAYFVTNLRLAYSFKIKGVKKITIGATIYNLFNEEYENNGYAGGGYYTDENGNRQRYNYAGYAAQAGVNAIGNITISF